MLINEFAFDPDCLHTWDRVRLVLNGVGIEHGRLLANYPEKDWPRLVRKACRGNCSDLDLQRVTERLVAAKPFLMAKGRGWNSTQTWVQNAVGAHVLEPFSSLISDTCFPPSPLVPCSTFDTFDTSVEWQAGTGRHIARTVSEIVTVIKPLAHISSRLVLVDPYLRPEAGYRTVLPQIFTACTHGTPLECLTLHVSSQYGQPHYWETTHVPRLKRLMPPHMRIELVVWDIASVGSGSTKPHDRAIWSEHGGLSFGWGFDEDPSARTFVQSFGKSEAASWAHQFTPGTSPCSCLAHSIVIES